MGDVKRMTEEQVQSELRECDVLECCTDVIREELHRAREGERELLQFVQFVNGYDAELPSDIVRRAAKLLMKAAGVE